VFCFAKRLTFLCVQPATFQTVGSWLDRIAGTGNTSLLAFVNGDQQAQVEYVHSMLGIAIFFVCLITIWCLTLLVIKFTGREKMGCAAGYAFHDAEGDEPSIIAARKSRGPSSNLFKGDTEDVSVGAAYGGGKSIAEDAGSSQQEGKKGWLGNVFAASSSHTRKSSSRSSRKEPMPNVHYDSDGDPMFDDDFMEPEPPFSPPKGPNKNMSPPTSPNQCYIKSSNDSVAISAMTDDNTYQYPNHGTNALYSIPKQTKHQDGFRQQCCGYQPHQVQRRKTRTRCVYGLFAGVSLLCCALLMTHMYAPLEASAMSTSLVVTDTQQVVAEVDQVLATLRDTATQVQQLYETTPLDYQQICPNVPAEIFVQAFGFDPQSVIDTITEEYGNYIVTAIGLLNDAQSISDTISSVLFDLDTSLNDTSEYLWLVPLLICFSMLVTFALGGLMVAVSYRESKEKNIQTEAPKMETLFGWTFLPLQVLVVLMAWGLVIATCFGTVVTTDSCVPVVVVASNPQQTVVGTPEDTILAVLETYTADSVDPEIVDRLEQYIKGCQGEDPLAELSTLQGVLTESLGLVNERVNLAFDVVGIEPMESLCGEGNRVRDFFNNIVSLQDELNRVDEALTQTKQALACPRLNDLYIRAIHGALCTEFATANASGFILFMAVAFSGMILISLRAAWRTSTS
jgi:hypothetical protein